ncbi:hypothetical protein [Oerskovia enterophila]|uniref:Uncharacterized protein n=1 Tax=Oerskovia enterophila TaxID=43678 RepID=A0ABX2Y8G1_9CELL|nr:hypothetical protein [Oerskovia enterophila]OCI32780.1 hypothetical protein OERS_03720 [Oerskovia enterophila]
MTTTSKYVELVGAQQRAARHATSMPLFVNALAMCYLTYVRFVDPGQLAAATLTPMVAYAALLLAMLLQRQLTGVGLGRDRYGIVAVGAIGLVVIFGPWAFSLLGASFFLGLGLVILGVRARDAWLWIPGTVLMVAGPAITFASPGLYILTACTVGMLAVSTTALVREQRTAKIDIS